MDEVTQAYRTKAAGLAGMLGTVVSPRDPGRSVVEPWAETVSGRILDVGAGTGRWTGHLAALGYDVEGLDQFVELARRAHPAVPFRHGSLADLVGSAERWSGILERASSSSARSVWDHQPGRYRSEIGCWCRASATAGHVWGMSELDADNGAGFPRDAMLASVAPARESPDAAAFRHIFETLFDDLVRYAERRVPESAVDDVVADTFLVAWRRFDELPNAPSDARAWLFAVARRVLANTHRGRRRTQAVAVRIASQPHHGGQDDAAAVAHRVDLARAFERLTSRDQEALALVAWDGLTPTEAARVLEISASAFSVRLSRARRRLREHLEPASSEGAF